MLEFTSSDINSNNDRSQNDTSNGDEDVETQVNVKTHFMYENQHIIYFVITKQPTKYHYVSTHLSTRREMVCS